MSTPEKNFENQIKRWLESEGIYKLGAPTDKMKVKPCGYYEKRLGSAMTGSGKPDLLIVVKGRCVEIEIKCESGRPSKIQLYILQQINNSGGFGSLVYPKDFESFKKKILELKHD